MTQLDTAVRLVRPDIKQAIQFLLGVIHDSSLT
jgi:hypothetical protein